MREDEVFRRKRMFSHIIWFLIITSMEVSTNRGSFRQILNKKIHFQMEAGRTLSWNWLDQRI